MLTCEQISPGHRFLSSCPGLHGEVERQTSLVHEDIRSEYLYLEGASRVGESTGCKPHIRVRRTLSQVVQFQHQFEALLIRQLEMIFDWQFGIIGVDDGVITLLEIYPSA